MDEPAGRGALAVRAGHADQGAADGRVSDDLLPRLDRDAGIACGDELGLVRIDGGQRLCDGQAIRAGCAGHVGGGVFRSDLDPECVEGRGVRRVPAGVAAGHDRAGVGRQERRRAGPSAGRSDHVDPLLLPDGPCPSDGLEPRANALGCGGHVASGAAIGSDAEADSSSGAAGCASIRSSRSSRAAAALRRLFSARSPVQTWRWTTAPEASATAT